MHDSYMGMLQERIRKDPHLKDHVILLVVVSSLLSFSLIFVHSMAAGIADKYAYIGSGHLTISGAYAGENAFPVRKSSALLYGSKKTVPLLVKGVGDDYFTAQRRKELSLAEQDGSILADDGGGKPRLAISERLASSLSLAVGDNALLVFPVDGSFKPVLCTVGVLFASGYAELDDSLVFCPLSLLQRFDAPLETEVLVDGNVSEAKQRLLQEGYNVSAWYEDNSDIADNLRTSQNVVTGVFFAIAFLAAYFISEFSSTMVTDKKREIATIKLMGMKDKEIRRVFFRAIFRISVGAVFIGVALGIILSYVSLPILGFFAKSGFAAFSYYLLSFPIRIPVVRILLVIAFLFVLSMISAAVSLDRIKKIEPISLIQA